MKKLNFEDFVSKVEEDIKGKRDFGEHVGTLEEFVTHGIYKSVKTDRNEVSELNLSGLLGIDFGESGAFIVGKLSEKYINDHYVLDGTDIKFKDKDGNRHEHPNIGGNTSWKGPEKQKTRELLSEFMHNHLITDETASLNYLGLEGPNFKSFLELYNSAKKDGVELKGTFVEYDLRTYNLMESIINSELGKEVFKNSRVIFRDINDLVALDFVRDETVRCDLGKRKLNGNAEDLVHYNGTDIEYVDYLAILDDIDQGNLTEKELLDKWKDVDVHEKNNTYWDEGLSEEFLEMMINRDEEKFDVVFLDYVGRITNRFLWSLDNLVQRRINDKAVISIVHNESLYRKTHLEELDKDNIFAGLSTEDERDFTPEERIKEIFERAGYKSEALTEEIVYRGESNSQKMNFQAWYVEKKK